MIIASLTGPTTHEAILQLRRTKRFIGAVEVRLDLLDDPDPRAIRRATRMPIIATCRPSWEGGRFAGSEEARMTLLHAAAEAGVDYVDLEAALGATAVARFRNAHPRVRIIASRHVFAPGPISAAREYAALRSVRADVVKFAFAAEDAADVAIAREFLRRARADRQKAVAIAMGDAGEASRILYKKYGGWATYASVEGGEAAAPGQVPAAMLSTLFRADRLTPRTRVCGLVGSPVRFSKGIYVFNPLFRRHGLNMVYCRFEVRDLAAFMAAMGGDLHGLSITQPHKRVMVRQLDGMDDTTRLIGAVNTAVRRGTKWTGTNTDAPGALDAIERELRVKARQVLVLGAGGAARAVAAEAKRRGAAVAVWNRTAERAAEIAGELGVTMVGAGEVREADIVANCTSVGMAPGAEATPLEAGAVRMKVAFDAVYNPRVTRFLREAAAAGARTVSGMEMFVNQAIRQYRLFTGRRVTVASVRGLIEKAANRETATT